MRFETINQYHTRTDFPETRLRAWCKEGKLPGFWSGKKYLINVDLFEAWLEAECKANAGQIE